MYYKGNIKNYETLVTYILTVFNVIKPVGMSSGLMKGCLYSLKKLRQAIFDLTASFQFDIYKEVSLAIVSQNKLFDFST